MPALSVPVLLWAGREDIDYPSMKSYSEDTGFELLTSDGDHVSTMLEMDDGTKKRLSQFLGGNAG
ncbi:hypothetical protein [Pseudomonas sp. Marseille-P9899]|uniref:hypothetical protein n=1 Tax=Pseudomonas sp. Marseille-P9899 TaxID=2730401 RepID=UPI00158BE07F|nr:hypothetical protein [Pseudomonas sp. Marseille-P9899]